LIRLLVLPEGHHLIMLPEGPRSLLRQNPPHLLVVESRHVSDVDEEPAKNAAKQHSTRPNANLAPQGHDANTTAIGVEGTDDVLLGEPGCLRRRLDLVLDALDDVIADCPQIVSHRVQDVLGVGPELGPHRDVVGADEEGSEEGSEEQEDDLEELHC
jgi:hypothetical protein